MPKSDKNILTKIQQKELTSVIDELVEERVLVQKEKFIKDYTKFIVESATSKVVERFKSGLVQQVEEKISGIQKKTEKVCRSVLAEAASKVSGVKKQHKQLLEEFKATAPKLITDLADKKVAEITEDARASIEENKRLNEAFKNFTGGLGKAGYVINEDLDNVVEKERNEKRMLRTKLVESRRDIKLHQLTEGMLPAQKKKVVELLEDCVTEKQVEDRFLTVKAKVLGEERYVDVMDTKKKPDSKVMRELTEEQDLQNLIGASSNYLQNK